MIIIELFAGVGGFRLGLEGVGWKKRKGSYEDRSFFKTGYANQWEPNSRRQIAAEVYKHHFGVNSVDVRDVSLVTGRDILNSIHEKIQCEEIREDLILVGGFPCQDYSVANSLKYAKGLEGVKGVLWWDIFRIISDLKSLGRQPKSILLENVDRLLKSPVSNRGRDFGTILMCLNFLGYKVEYMVINGADYGFPQRRRRVFIYAEFNTPERPCILKNAFPMRIKENLETISLAKAISTDAQLRKALEKIEFLFDGKSKIPPFGNYGTAEAYKVNPMRISPIYDGNLMLLKDIIHSNSDGKIPQELFVPESGLNQWKEAKQAGTIERIGVDRNTGIRNFRYKFSVGNMQLYDSLYKPLRTIITSEGSLAPSRTSHLIQVDMPNCETGVRKLSVLEMERANTFPDNYTRLPNLSYRQRAFLMGNALIVGIVEKIRDEIIKSYKNGIL